jgi:hypothetical protein
MKLLVSVDRITGVKRIVNPTNTPNNFSALYAQSVARCYKDSDIKIYVLDVDLAKLEDPLPEDRFVFFTEEEVSI